MEASQAIARHPEAVARVVAEGQAEEIKLRAERRAGELLRDQPKQRGGGDHRSEPATGAPPTYAEQGIDKRDASTWQRIAEIPEERFEQFIAEAPTAAEPPSKAGWRRQPG